MQDFGGTGIKGSFYVLFEKWNISESTMIKLDKEAPDAPVLPPQRR